MQILTRFFKDFVRVYFLGHPAETEYISDTDD